MMRHILEARPLASGLMRVSRMDVQFMDVKLMSELSERYRKRVRTHITAYRLWQAAQAGQPDPIAGLYAEAEGVMMHRRITDDLKLWYLAHRDYHAMRRAYLAKCMGTQARVDWQKTA